MIEIQKSKQDFFGHLEIVNWYLFGIWNLVIGI